MYLKQNLKDVTNKNMLLDQYNLITCGRCEYNFIIAKSAKVNFCPNCGKELGREVQYKSSATAPIIRERACSGLLPDYYLQRNF